MVSPHLVYEETQEETVIEHHLITSSNKKSHIETIKRNKLVRDDFGVLDNGQVDPNNLRCFETNGAFFLMQFMQRNLVQAVIDLSDGNINKIVYPYGFEYTEGEGEVAVQSRILAEETGASGAENKDQGKDQATEGETSDASKPPAETPQVLDYDEKAHISRDKTNDDHLFQKIAEILAKVGGSNSKVEGMSDFKIGSSKKFRETKTDSFNMFIDFAYGASFNNMDINIKHCAHEKAQEHLQNSDILNNSYRALAINIVFEKQKDDVDSDDFYGHELRLKEKLYSTLEFGFNIITPSKISQLKSQFGNAHINASPWKIEQKDETFGVSSRFIFMMHKLSEILNPSIVLYFSKLSDDSSLEFYKEDEILDFSKSIVPKKNQIKSFKGGVELSMVVRGCLDDVEIWSKDTKLTLAKKEFLEDSQEYDIHVRIPDSMVENPFANPDIGVFNMGVETFGESELPEKNANSKTLNEKANDIEAAVDKEMKNLKFVKINNKTNSYRSIKLQLRCKYPIFKLMKSRVLLPQTHLARGLLDSGYSAINYFKYEIELQATSDSIQISIEHLYDLSAKYMIMQEKFSNIDVLSSQFLFIDFNMSEDRDYIYAQIKDNSGNEMYQNYENNRYNYVKEERINNEPGSYPPKDTFMFKYEENSLSITSFTFMKQLLYNWNVSVMEYSDIGCCSTQTQGKTEAAFVNHPIKLEKKKNVYRNEFGKLVFKIYDFNKFEIIIFI